LRAGAGGSCGESPAAAVTGGDVVAASAPTWMLAECGDEVTAAGAAHAGTTSMAIATSRVVCMRRT
jgi:hypothetical protein